MNIPSPIPQVKREMESRTRSRLMPVWKLDE
jgi:hypothetical protein